MMEDAGAVFPAPAALPNNRKLSALTKEELPGRMKMLRGMCDSAWVAVTHLRSHPGPVGVNPRLCPSGGTGRRASFRS